MSNPLVQGMPGIPSGATGGPNALDALARLGNIAKMMRKGNPEKIAKALMQQNPQFRAFMQASQGKSPEQVAREHGVDLGQIMKQL